MPTKRRGEDSDALRDSRIAPGAETEGCRTVATPDARVRRGWRGLSVALGLVLLLSAVIVARIHPFLACTAPVPTRVMVVEGWLPDVALEEVAERFRADSYDLLLTTGGPLPRGSHLSEYGSYAAIAAATLIKLGIPTNRIAAVASEERDRQRTYASALALKTYCRQRGIELGAINLFSEGVHARRSWLCFRRALGSEVAVGIVSIRDRDYAPDRWWRYSEGVKMVLGEVVGLTYAWLTIDYGD